MNMMIFAPPAMRMHEHARRNVGGREADRHVVLENGLALFDCARSDLVAGGNLAAAGQPVRELSAYLHVRTRDDDVVRVVQPDRRVDSGFLQSLDHDFTSSITR